MLILASDNVQHYIDSQNLFKKYMNNHPNIKSLFCKCNPNLEQDFIFDQDNNTLYVKYQESYIPGILYKTIKSFDYICKNFEFDYIFKTNMSSVIDLDKMYTYISNNKLQYGDELIETLSDSGVLENANGIKFSSEYGFFISKNTCILLMNNEIIPYNSIDDAAIEYTINKLVEITEIPLTDIILNNPELLKPYNEFDKNIFHFRCRQETNDSETVVAQKIILNKIYPELNFTD